MLSIHSTILNKFETKSKSDYNIYYSLCVGFLIHLNSIFKNHCLAVTRLHRMFCSLLFRNIHPLVLDQTYINLKNQVIKAERRVLKELGFCVHVKHPHKVGYISFVC